MEGVSKKKFIELNIQFWKNNFGFRGKDNWMPSVNNFDVGLF